MLRSICAVAFLVTVFQAFGAHAAGQEAAPPFDNADFEAGDLRGWTADPNWRVDNNAAGGWYSGWQGLGYAWSGQGGEPATGRLRSPEFALTQPGVEVWIAGWADIRGRTAGRWNYVTLNLADGTELDRRYAPNSVAFTPVVLFSPEHIGARVYIEAVDNAAEATFSMLCIDKVSVVDVALAPPVSPAKRGKVHVLENGLYRIEVDRRNGAIRRILDKKGGLELIREPRLADNFEFSLPIKKEAAWMSTEANYILGRDQRLTSCERRADELTLTWKGPLHSVFDIDYDVTVTMHIGLTPEDVVFNLRVENRSALELGEVYYPILGGMLGLGETRYDLKDTCLALPYDAGLRTSRPFHTFDNMSPFGSLYPEQYHRYPDALSMPWLDMYSPRLRRGVYFGAHDPIARNKTFQLEQLPGTASLRMDGNWPRPEELEGRPAGVRMCLVHIVYQPPGQVFDAAPVVLRFHDGDWRAGAAVYRGWFTREVGPVQAPGWLGKVSGYYSCGRVSASQLAGLATAALGQSLNALLLTDWKAGEEYRGSLQRDLASSLGTPEDIKQAIEQCHAIGVRVVFLLGGQHADAAAGRYREELHRYASIDRWGVAATWGERRWHYINPAFADVRAALAEQVCGLAALGADGVHLRDFFPVTYDFNPALQQTPDRATWEGGLACITQMLDAARALNPGFCISTNFVRDRLMCAAPVSEAENPEISAYKEVFPEWHALSVAK